MLSEEQRLIQATARDFAQREIAPNAARWEREGFDLRAVLAQLGRLGFMGLCVDEAWGGSGGDFLSYVLAVEEIAAADAGICNSMCVNNSPIAAAIQDYGTDAQKERILRPIASGEMFGAFLLSEPQAGSDAANLHTRARRDGDRYVVNGTKQFITVGRTADIAMIIAVTDPEAGKRGISCFLVPTDTPGYTVARVEDKLGHRNCDTCQIVMEDMSVPADTLLGKEGEGYRIALAYLEGGRIGVAAQSVGLARAAYEAALAYAKERESFGRKIVEHQAVGFKLADMATQVEAARQLTYAAAQIKDAGKPALREASMAKLFASEVAERVASDAIQIHGGYGYLSDYPVEKIWRDARVMQIYEGTSEVQRLVLARQLAAE